MRTEKNVYWLIGIVAVTLIGFLVIPTLMNKIGNKLYKASLKNDEIDFENMEPKIVKKKKEGGLSI